MLIYSGGLIDATTGKLTSHFAMTKQTPPAFCLHAGDDKSVENSVAVYLAQKQFGIPAELHIYAKGGHGFGIRGPGPSVTWPGLLDHWISSLK